MSTYMKDIKSLPEIDFVLPISLYRKVVALAGQEPDSSVSCLIVSDGSPMISVKTFGHKNSLLELIEYLKDGAHAVTLDANDNGLSFQNTFFYNCNVIDSSVNLMNSVTLGKLTVDTFDLKQRPNLHYAKAGQLFIPEGSLFSPPSTFSSDSVVNRSLEEVVEKRE